MPEKMCFSIRVRNYHIDSHGHVNNAQYLIFLEEARTVFLERLGYSLVELKRDGIQIFITEIKVKYRSPAKLGDDLNIYGWFNEVSSRRATWQHEIIDNQSGNLVLTGTVSGMFLRNGRIATIPADISETLMQLYIPA